MRFVVLIAFLSIFLCAAKGQEGYAYYKQRVEHYKTFAGKGSNVASPEVLDGAKASTTACCVCGTTT